MPICHCGCDKEAHGRRRDNKSDPHVSAVTEKITPQTESVSLEIEEALTKKVASMNSVTIYSAEHTLGSVPMYNILVNDTGFPATVFPSIEFPYSSKFSYCGLFCSRTSMTQWMTQLCHR